MRRAGGARGGPGARGWGGRLLAALLALSTAAAEVVFRVPEVTVQHAAAPRPVGTGPSHGSRANGSRANESRGGDSGPRADRGMLDLRYEEYYVEHEVSAADAKGAARLLNLKDTAKQAVGCGACSRRDLEYCESRVLADHCCCERRFLPEPFPWLPHTCYLGPSRCRPLAHDCARYARLRDCCCSWNLAVKWKGILSKAVGPSAYHSAFMVLVSAALLAVII